MKSITKTLKYTVIGAASLYGGLQMGGYIKETVSLANLYDETSQFDARAAQATLNVDIYENNYGLTLKILTFGEYAADKQYSIDYYVNE